MYICSFLLFVTAVAAAYRQRLWGYQALLHAMANQAAYWHAWLWPMQQSTGNKLVNAKLRAVRSAPGCLRVADYTVNKQLFSVVRDATCTTERQLKQTVDEFKYFPDELQDAAFQDYLLAMAYVPGQDKEPINLTPIMKRLKGPAGVFSENRDCTLGQVAKAASIPDFNNSHDYWMLYTVVGSLRLSVGPNVELSLGRLYDIISERAKPPAAVKALASKPVKGD